MKQLFHITAGDDKEMVKPVLSMRLGEKHCSFSIADIATNELLQLAYYTADDVNESFLFNLFAAHHELNGNFYQVLICSDHPQSTLVPQQYFRQEDAGLLLKTLYGINGSSSIVTEVVAEWELYNIYGVPKDVSNWIGKKFVVARYQHQYTVSLKNINAAETGGTLLIDFRTEDFTVMAADNNKLLLAQTYLYSKPEDVIYYLLKICTQFKLSQQEVHVGLSGLVDQQSALYRELYQYFLHVKFRDATWNVPASIGNEWPAHFFTSLNDISGCAS